MNALGVPPRLVTAFRVWLAWSVAAVLMATTLNYLAFGFPLPAGVVLAIVEGVLLGLVVWRRVAALRAVVVALLAYDVFTGLMSGLVGVGAVLAGASGVLVAALTAVLIAGRIAIAIYVAVALFSRDANAWLGTAKAITFDFRPAPPPPPPRACEQCGAGVPHGAYACPTCGATAPRAG